MGIVMEGHTWAGSLRLEIRPVREAKSMFKLHYGVWGEGTLNSLTSPNQTCTFRCPYMDSAIQICLQTLQTKQETVICRSGRT